MRLLATEPEEIPQFLQGMVEEAKKLKRELANIQWHLKGLGMADVYVMSPRDRAMYAEVISENIEKFAKLAL